MPTFFCAYTTFAQKRNNVWVFGNHAGIDFNQAPVKGLDTTAIETPTNGDLVYASSICDTNGRLLFYTDGFTTWNRKHEVLPKYQYRWPWISPVMPLICPYPGNDSLYYIFGVSIGSYANRLQAMTINMSGNRGAGEIVYPPPPVDSTNYYELLLSNASVFVAGTAHCNRKDTWIVTHAGNSFYSFLVTEKGIDKTPVVSPVPANIMGQGIYEGGNIKFSASGEKLIVPMLRQNKIVVMDFDNLTGKFSGFTSLSIPPKNYLTDIEISPDGGKLYIAAYTWEEEADPGSAKLHTIAQMDLEKNGTAEIEKSYYSFNADFPDKADWCTPKTCFLLTRTMELGPDGRIYISMTEITGRNRERNASFIEEPNELGIKARYRMNRANLGKVYRYFKYNYIRSSTFTPKQNGIQVQKNVCADQPVNFSLLFNRMDSVRWDFGDPASGLANYSAAQKPQHIYPGPGTYTVKAILYNSCLVDTAFAKVLIEKEKTVQISQSVKDSIVCLGNELMMDATTPYATEYLWGGGNVAPVQKITVSGTYAVTVANSCSVDSKSFHVQFQECDCKVFIPTAFTPNDDGLNDIFKPITSCFAQQYRFSVYNRSGGLIFTSTDRGRGWNGRLNNQPSPTGVYVWVLQYQDPNNRQFFKKSGTVTILR